MNNHTWYQNVLSCFSCEAVFIFNWHQLETTVCKTTVWKETDGQTFWRAQTMNPTRIL